MKLVLSVEMTSALFQDGQVPLWVYPWVTIAAEGPGDPIGSEHGLTLGVRLLLWLPPPLGKEGLRAAWRERMPMAVTQPALGVTHIDTASPSPGAKRPRPTGRALLGTPGWPRLPANVQGTLLLVQEKVRPLR